MYKLMDGGVVPPQKAAALGPLRPHLPSALGLSFWPDLLQAKERAPIFPAFRDVNGD
jgi:hypothetical protein